MNRIIVAINKIGIAVITIATLLSSCTETINFEGEITNPKLVIHSYITPGEPISAIIRESRFIFSDSTEYLFVKDADVSVFVNNTFVEKLIMHNNTWKREVEYKGEYKPKINDKIKLIIKRPNKAEVFAETQIEKPIEIIKIDTASTDIQYSYVYENEEVKSYSKHFNLNFEMHFKDDGSKHNYYRLLVELVTITNSNNWSNETTSLQKVNITNISTDININKDPLSSALNQVLGGFSSEVSSYNIFKDEIFNAKTFNLKFSTPAYYRKLNPNYSGNLSNSNNDSKLIFRITLQSISKEFYEYLASLIASANTNPFFSEAVQIKSNIVGGIGVFGTYTNSNVREFEFVYEDN